MRTNATIKIARVAIIPIGQMKLDDDDGGEESSGLPWVSDIFTFLVGDSVGEYVGKSVGLCVCPLEVGVFVGDLDGALVGALDGAAVILCPPSSGHWGRFWSKENLWLGISMGRHLRLLKLPVK